MRILVVTNMWPGVRSPLRGIFVREQVEALRRGGLEVDVISADVPAVGRRAYATLAGRVFWRGRDGSYDVVHAHYGLTGAAIAPLPLRVPRVLTLHGSDVNIAWQRRLSRWAARRCARVVYVSEALRARLGVAGEVVPCGVDLQHFRRLPRPAARRRIGLDGDAVVLLFGGARRNPVKGFSRLDAALARLPPPRPTVLELDGVPREEVPWLMAAADVLVLTSLHEGSPQVVKEALACGLPVVAVPVGDVPAQLEGLADCRLVQPDPEALARAVLEVGSRHRRLVLPEPRRQALSNDVVAARLTAIYHRLAGGDGSLESPRGTLR